MTHKLTIDVIETNGTINETETLQSCQDQLTALKADRHNRHERIATAVAAIFDRFPGGRINLPDLTTMILVELGLPPNEYGSWRPATLTVVRDNCQGEQRGSQVERPESLLLMHRGKEGGVARRADMKTAVPSLKAVA